jgi:hypothetical protein
VPLFSERSISTSWPTKSLGKAPALLGWSLIMAFVVMDQGVSDCGGCYPPIARRSSPKLLNLSGTLDLLQLSRAGPARAGAAGASSRGSELRRQLELQREHLGHARQSQRAMSIVATKDLFGPG